MAAVTSFRAASRGLLQSLHEMTKSASSPLCRSFMGQPKVTPPPDYEITSSSFGFLKPCSADIPARVGAVAVKCGMTQLWNDLGERIPVTVLWLDENEVTQVKTEAKEGYNAVQVGAGYKRDKRVDAGLKGHFMGKGLNIKRKTKEFRVHETEILPLGTSINAALFLPGQYVDIQGTTIGKGTQGAMKRWGFAGGPASHGATKHHRKLGSTGGCQDPGRVWKGKKMAGRMGNKTRTVQNVNVLKVDKERNLLYVRGQVPGHRGNFVFVKDAIKGIRFKDAPKPTEYRTSELLERETSGVLRAKGI